MLEFSPLLPAAAQQAGGAAEISGAASQTLGIAQTATGAVEVHGAGARVLAIAQTAAGAVEVHGAGAQVLAIAQTAAGAVAETGINGAASQTLGIAQTATGTVDVLGVAAQTLAISQTATGAGPGVQGAAAQTLTISQTARGLLGGQIMIWRAVHDAVYVALVAALADVAAIYDAVPPNAPYPYVDLAAQNRVPADTLSRRGHNFQIFPAVYSQHRGAQEVRAILDAMDAALHNARLTLATGHAVRCQVTDAKCMRDADGRSYQGGATIEIFVVI